MSSEAPTDNGPGWCRYAWASAELATPDAAALERLGALEPDCGVISPSAEAIELSWPSLEASFFEQTERLPLLPADQGERTPVRVEIIDSAVTRRAADGEPSNGRLEHGRAMGLIVRKLACPAPGPSCRAEVASTLALPLVHTPSGTARDTVNGGRFGTFSDLAVAIHDAVNDWQQSASDHRLVINLSLGWEPTHGGEYSDDAQALPASVYAVWAAIARARCMGAAVVAAAGNRVEGPNAASGATYPAAWANKRAPSAELCKTIGVAASQASSDEPFVFAVGGIEANDADLSLSRADSRPELIAPASHAVVQDAPGAPSALHTGTSVAAAVTSAAAAVVWSYRGDLTAGEVFDLVHSGGADVGRPADICLEGDVCRSARRVSLCGAMQAACEGGEGSCPSALPQCERRPGGRVARPERVDLPTGTVVSAHSLEPVGQVGWPCSGTLYAPQDAVVSNPCPASQLEGAEPLGAVRPQPNKGPMCPHCTLAVATGELYVEIDPNAIGVLTNPVLKLVVDSAGPDVRYFDLSSELPELYAGDIATVTDLDLGTSVVESATIEFIVDGSHSDLSPVLPW